MDQLKNIQPGLLVYGIAGVIYFISALSGYEYLVYVFKPIFASSMIFHYCNESKWNLNYWYALFLFLYFFSGILNLFEDDKTLFYVILLNISAYTILLSLLIKKVVDINFTNIDNINLLYIILTLVFLSTLVYVCLGLVFSKGDSLYPYFVLYAIILTSLAVCSTILYTLKHSNAIVYLMVAIFCYLICDLFYIVYYYYYNLFFFRLLSILSSILSYYFVVNYFLKSSESPIYESNLK